MQRCSFWIAHPGPGDSRNRVRGLEVRIGRRLIGLQLERYDGSADRLRVLLWRYNHQPENCRITALRFRLWKFALVGYFARQPAHRVEVEHRLMLNV